LKKNRFERIHKTIEDRFIKNLEMLDMSSKERFLETFASLWKKKKSFKEHIKTRLRYKHVPERNAEMFYAKKIFEVLASHNKVIIEKTGKVNYIQNEDWIVVLTKQGKIKTAFKLDIPLQKWKNSHKFMGKDEVENYESKQIKTVAQRILGRIRKF